MAVILAMAFSVSSLAACSSGSSATTTSAASTSTASQSTSGSSSTQKKLKIALVYSGFLGDKSFNDSAHKGAEQAVKDFGIELKELESGEAADWESNFVSMADAKYDLVIGVSTQFSDIMKQHCPDYPNQKFALIDGVVSGSNIESTSFAQNEGSFLAGAAAAMFTTRTEISGINKEKTIGWVGGMDIPVLHDFFVGYEQGAKYIDPDIKILQSFAGTFTDALKGKELANAQFNQGADIVMNVANITGMGVLEAAKDQNKFAIGVDTNQDSIYPGHIITSMMKRVDVCTYNIIESVVKGTFKGNSTTYMDIAHDGVEITDMSTIEKALGEKFPKDILTKLNELKTKIKEGKITVNHYEGFGPQ